ncbi:hypothetical protein SLEP1_g27095 [Rubroshorea leprosula]|uniref:Uncharacterized protein n=1 Tax=Rubroshorea leprosula TaxID=152421 RepID=A0AAV5K0M0_9ROSI|nr:hypothetical protein SLEP1_g27095 [Rubroshorea leprosula]
MLFRMNGKKKSLVLFDTEEQVTAVLLCNHSYSLGGSIMRISLSATVKEKTCINLLMVWSCNGVLGLEIHCFPGYLYGWWLIFGLFFQCMLV